MSQAPVLESEYQGTAREYVEATVELNRRVDAGTSWSGNERNNLFLNLGKLGNIPAFADASALMGFDFPDDSRGLVSIDWDFDGDLDFITTNRTAPRVRILENRITARHKDFLSLRLVGEKTNRDAIGSRVELSLLDQSGDEMLLVRRLHAGQGFISQSSKWLHFGIPTGAKIERLLVKWYGAGAEVFTGAEIGKFQEFHQGSGIAQDWAPPTSPALAGKMQALEALPSTSEIAYLERPIPLPGIPYFSVDGEEKVIDENLERPLVLNLWATWCVPCLAELKGFTRDSEKWKNAGVHVLALCVDAEVDDHETTEKANSILEDLEFPFEAGIPSDHTIELLHLAHNTAFIRPDKLPVPTTLLIDKKGRIAGIYRGVIGFDDVASAVAALSAGEDEWERFANPFEGIWHHGPDTVFYVGIAKEMLERGWTKRAERFLLNQRESLEKEGQKYAELLMVLGTQLVDSKEYGRGIRLLEIAVELSPNLAVAHNNLAVALLQVGQTEKAVGHLEKANLLDPQFVDPALNLARFRVANEDFPEAAALLAGISKNGYHPGVARLMAQIQLKQNNLDAVLQTFHKIVRHEQGDAVAWLNLGKLQYQLGDATGAESSLKMALQLNPGNTEVRTWLNRVEKIVPSEDSL